MKSTLLTYIDRFRQNRRERLVLGSVLLFLAVIVSLIVYWQLRYTGITMSNETFCGYEEHVHAEECYDEEGNLVCELEEHSHTVDCLINLNADVEDATVWKATLPELTGDLRTDVVNIAYSQLGYTESTANFSPGEDGVTRYGYTRYGAWYGNEYGTWDAMFVSFCLNYAGVDRTAFPLNSGAYSWAVELSEIGSYAEASAYTPLAGDIVFFDSDYDGRIDRVGIVASTDISGGVVTIIEGDYTVSEVDTVCEHIYALNDPTISGYGIIAASEEAEEETEAEETDDETEDTEESEEIEIEETEDTEETEEETEESPTLFYTASDSGVNVTVIAPEGALPDGAALAVTLLDEESDEYAEAAEAVGYEDSEDTGMAALDITFYDELGIEVEPSLPVTVTVDITEIIPEGTTADTIEVTHITDTEVSTVETLVETVTDTTNETAVVVFETESFSTFTIQWGNNNNAKTVTVHVCDTDGNEISYSSLSTITFNNNTTVTLSSLCTVNGYTFDHANVTYTNSNGYGATTVTLEYVASVKYSSGYNGGYTITYDAGGTTGINQNTDITIYLYFKASSTATLTVNKVYKDASGSEFTADSSLSATFTATNQSTNATTTVTIAGTSSGTLSLSAGTYTLSETAAGGYTAASDMTVTVSDGVIYVDDTDITDNDNTITITNSPDSNHKYAGMSYAIANLENNNKNTYAIMASANSSGGLDGLSIEVVSTDSDGIATIKGDATIWTFEAASGDNNYYIYTTIGSTKYYLNVTNTSQSGVSISTTEQILTVTTDSDTGKVRITNTAKSAAVNWYGGSNSGNLVFGGYNGSDNNEWLTLCLIYQPDGVYITDNIAASGELVANYVVDGVAMDLTDSSKYIIAWEKDSPKIDSEACTWTYSGSYEKVTNEEALSDKNNYAVNVALDGGALARYKVTIYDATTNEEIGYATYEVPYAAEIMNCSFEVPDLGDLYEYWDPTNYQYDESSVKFWNTTASDGLIEIGDYEADTSTYGSYRIYAGGNHAYSGDQFAELAANTEGSLYQDVLTIGGEALNWSLYHRARTSSGTTVEDTMYVVIMSAEEAQAVLDYASANNLDEQDYLREIIDSILDSGSDVDGNTDATDSATGKYPLGNGETVTVTVWQLTTTTTVDGEWTYYYGEYEVPDDQYLTRFFFVSGDTGSGNETVGNLIDYATFSQDITYVIEYWTKDSGATEYTLQSTYTEKDTVDPYTNVYASYLSVFSDYGLVGSVTGTTSGGSNPSAFDEITTTGMRVQSGTVYLSLYLSKPVVTIVKIVEGLSEEEIDAYLDAGNTYTVGFTITPSANALTNGSLSITVGETGSGSTYTAESEYTAAGNYNITESGYPTSITIDGVEYEWTGATVTVDGETVEANTDGSYTYYIDGENSVTITFTNTYAEVETGGPEMPQTGGRGTKLYTMVGLLLICSGGYLLYRKQKRKCNRRWNI